MPQRPPPAAAAHVLEELYGETMARNSCAADLLRSVGAGDSRAWALLVDRYIPIVRSVIRSFRLVSWDAEEVSQAVWLRVAEHVDDIRYPEALPGWIRTCARNECLSVLRRNGRTIPVGSDLENRVGRPTYEVDPTDALFQQNRHEALLEAMSALPDLQRKVLEALLSDAEPSYDEISARQGIPRGSIGPTRARALDNLRASAALAALAIHEVGDKR